MGFFKKQLLSVIEWKDSNNDVIVYRFPMEKDAEIMHSSSLIVRESQVALFIHKGEIADVFGPGTYKLSTENLPFLTKLLSWSTKGESRIKAEVYFVNTKRFMGLKWGTQNPIMMRDVDFGNIRVRGFGSFAIKVDDARKFMKECFGTNAVYRVGDIVNQYKSILVQLLTDAIGESKVSALDLAANYVEFSSKVEEKAAATFDPLGLKVTNFVVENLSLPDEVEKMLDERTKMGVIEDKMGTYTQYKAANAMGDIAKNPSSGGIAGLGAGLGVGLGAGVNMGEMFASSIANAKNTTKTPAAQCVKCGSSISARAKFCPECGATQSSTCPKCGEVVSKNSKFCASCGEKLKSTEKTCAGCGKVLTARAKFCPDCGEKVN